MTFVLVLNDMRAPQIEMGTEVCRAETAQEIADLLESEAVDPYQDGQWGKKYRAGGPLEWFNPCWRMDEQPDGSIGDPHYGHGIINAGTLDERLGRLPRDGSQDEALRDWWSREIMGLPSAAELMKGADGAPTPA